MTIPSDDWESQREKIIGLGERSTRKSYYPELMRRLEELERFRTLLDFSNDAVFLLEAPSNQIIDVNRSACDQIGHTREQVLTQPLEKFVPEDDAKRINTFLCDESTPNSVGKLITTYLHTAQHSELPVEITVQRVKLGDQAYGILVARDISTRLRMEHELRKSEERYRNLFDGMPVGLYRTTPGGQFIDVNPALATMLGYTDLIALLATNAEDLYVNPHERVQWQQLLEREGVVRNFETQARRADGSIIWVRNTARVVRDENRNIVFYEGSVEDITEQKQAENALRTTLIRTEVLYRTSQSLIAVRNLSTLLQTVVDGVVETLPADRVTLVTLDIENRRVPHFVVGGPGKQHVVRVDFDELWQGLSGWVYRERIPAFSPKDEPDPRESPAVQQRRAETHCGSIAVVPIVAYGDKTMGVIVAINRPDQDDFTQSDVNLMAAMANLAAIAIENANLYQELEDYNSALERMVETRTEELRHTKDHIEAILNSVSEALVVTAPDGIIQQVNPAFEQQTGYEAENILSSHISVLRGETNSFNRFGEIITSMRRGKMWSGEVRIRRKDDSSYDAVMTISPVRHPESETVAIVGSIRDISAFKEVERMKDAFVSNVSHELRTPIANLKLRYHLLAAQPAKLDTHLAVIQRETDRLAQIIEDLLNLSRIDQEEISWNPTWVDINVLAQEYIEDRMVLAQRQDIHLSFVAETNLPVIQMDAGLISQALGILLTNALNYTPAGGDVTVKSQQLARQGRQWLVLSVKDNGRGIPHNEQSSLFERFFRGSAGMESGAPGTGLGLSIAQEIMKKHQGRIEVSSSGIPGEGAEFSLWLPVI